MDFFSNDYAVRIKDFSEMFGLHDNTPYELIKRYPEVFKTEKRGRHTYIPASAIHFYHNLKKKSEDIESQIILFYNRKGGVGKTTVLLNLATRSCMHGLKVVIVDLDSQANITRSFKIENPKEKDTFLSVFNEDVSVMDAIQEPKKNLHIIPANNKLSKLATEIDVMQGFRQFMKHFDELKKHYDVVLIDCGGIMDMTTFQALACADKIVSPAFPDEYSDEGLELTIEEIKKIRSQGFNPKHYIVLNKIDASFREKATKEYVALFEDLYDDVAETRIRRSQDIVNSISEGSSVFEQSYDSKVALEIESLYQEVILGQRPKLFN